MKTDYLLDTSFLLTLEGEVLSGREEGAIRFLHEHDAAVLHISVITYGEMCTAFTSETTELRDQILGRYNIIHVDERIAWHYSQEFARLRADQGSMIAPNDLWIGSTALAFSFPLVACNPKQFRRIHGLTVVAV